MLNFAVFANHFFHNPWAVVLYCSYLLFPHLVKMPNLDVNPPHDSASTLHRTVQTPMNGKHGGLVRVSGGDQS